MTTTERQAVYLLRRLYLRSHWTPDQQTAWRRLLDLAEEPERQERRPMVRVEGWADLLTA